MATKTEHVTYRIGKALWDELEREAKAAGVSENGYACAALIEKLEGSNLTATVDDIRAEVRKLRADLALATQAILTVTGGTEASGPRAMAWVRKHLNQE